MLIWQDEGIILSTKNFSESSLLIKVFTKNHGLSKGLVLGAKSKKNIYIYQSGNNVTAKWSARTDENLGRFNCELISGKASFILGNPLNLSAIVSMLNLLEFSMVEKEVEVALYDKTLYIMDIITSAQHSWVSAYVEWEVFLLAKLGFGLDLSQCVLTRKKENLKYVSPKTGKAVSENAAGKWKNRLLYLPQFLIDETIPNLDEINDGLKITENFLIKFALSVNKKLPFSRNDFIKKLSLYYS